MRDSASRARSRSSDAEIPAGPEECVHRPLPVRGHQDDRGARRRVLAHQGRVHARLGHPGRELIPAGSRPMAPLKTGEGGDGTARAAAVPRTRPHKTLARRPDSHAIPRAVLAALPPGRSDRRGSRPRSAVISGVFDQVHRAGVLPEPLEKPVVDVGNHVHQGIFDSEQEYTISSRAPCAELTPAIARGVECVDTKEASARMSIITSQQLAQLLRAVQDDRGHLQQAGDHGRRAWCRRTCTSRSRTGSFPAWCSPARWRARG